MAQNRSHYVNSSTSSQFKSLDVWLAANAAPLQAILGPPGQFVLYGEWLYARHSLAYTHLPDYFLAFDLLHVPSRRFLSRASLRRRLWGSGIACVREVVRRAVATREDLIGLLDTPSQYAPVPLEGVYVRVEDAAVDGPGADGVCVMSFVTRQAKAVRADFVAGIEDHWASRALERNLTVH